MKAVTLPLKLPPGQLSAHLSPQSQHLPTPRPVQNSHGHQYFTAQKQKMRQDHIASCQRKIEEGWQAHAQKERQYMQLKQLKALSNKSYGLIERSRKVELDNFRKGQAFERHRHEQKSRLLNSQSIALDNSGELEVLRQGSIERTKKSRREAKECIQPKVHIDEAFNPQIFETSRYSPQEGIKDDRSGAATVMVKQERDETQMQNDFSKQTIMLAEQSKNERINEARAMKNYLLLRKSKQLADRDYSAKANQLNNIKQLRVDLQHRKETINERLNPSKGKKKKGSLPAIYGNKVIKVLFNGPGEEWRRKKQKSRSPFDLIAATEQRRQRNASMMALMGGEGWQ